MLPYSIIWPQWVYILKPEQNEHQFEDNIFKINQFLFFNLNSIKLNFLGSSQHEVRIGYGSACHQIGDNTLL